MPAKKTIYIIRHGQTDYNKQGIIQGSGVDSDLNEKGRFQANQFYKAYHHIPFDKIYSSQLKRTIQSIEPFIKAGFSHETLEELNEINWGIFQGMQSTPDSHQVYKRIIADWQAGLLDRAVENGETPNQLQKRQAIGLKKIMAKEEEEIILISMHGRAMRSFICLLTNTPLQQMDKFKHNNLCLYQLEQVEGNQFKITIQNNQEHLWI